MRSSMLYGIEGGYTENERRVTFSWKGETKKGEGGLPSKVSGLDIYRRKLCRSQYTANQTTGNGNESNKLIHLPFGCYCVWVVVEYIYTI